MQIVTKFQQEYIYYICCSGRILSIFPLSYTTVSCPLQHLPIEQEDVPQPSNTPKPKSDLISTAEINKSIKNTTHCSLFARYYNKLNSEIDCPC
jgi:hypothetical protein